MIASLSAVAGCPSPALPDLWLPPRARGATRLPPLRSGKAAIPPLQRFQRPTTPAQIKAVRAARRATCLQKLWAPLRARATFADVQRARDAEKRKKDLAFKRRRRRRKPPAPATPPRPATPPPRTPPATPPPKKPRKALPPLPPPKPAAVDASLGRHPRRSRVDHVKNKDAVTKPVLRRLDGLLVVPPTFRLDDAHGQRPAEMFVAHQLTDDKMFLRVIRVAYRHRFTEVVLHQ